MALALTGPTNGTAVGRIRRSRHPAQCPVALVLTGPTNGTVVGRIRRSRHPA
ncbi:hypothetical protein HMPREF3220_04156, partial [Citrobacter koseri]